MDPNASLPLFSLPDEVLHMEIISRLDVKACVALAMCCKFSHSYLASILARFKHAAGVITRWALRYTFPRAQGHFSVVWGASRSGVTTLAASIVTRARAYSIGTHNMFSDNFITHKVVVPDHLRTSIPDVRIAQIDQLIITSYAFNYIKDVFKECPLVKRFLRTENCHRIIYLTKNVLGRNIALELSTQCGGIWRLYHTTNHPNLLSEDGNPEFAGKGKKMSRTRYLRHWGRLAA